MPSFVGPYVPGAPALQTSLVGRSAPLSKPAACTGAAAGSKGRSFGDLVKIELGSVVFWWFFDPFFDAFVSTLRRYGSLGESAMIQRHKPTDQKIHLGHRSAFRANLIIEWCLKSHRGLREVWSADWKSARTTCAGVSMWALARFFSAWLPVLQWFVADFLLWDQELWWRRGRWRHGRGRRINERPKEVLSLRGCVVPSHVAFPSHCV